jgi:hypothetical protein
VYIGDTTAMLLEGGLELFELGTFHVRGSSVPLRLFELRGQGATVAGQGRQAEGRTHLAVAA